MPINPDAVGSKTKPGHGSWESKDALLYALGVGCGVDDLAFVTENSHGIEQQVLPTMGVVLGTPGSSPFEKVGEIDWTMLLHGEQSIELHAPIPVSGTVESVAEIVGIYDKGSGAVIVMETQSKDADSGQPMWTTRSATFIRGAGGFGGDRGPSGKRNAAPERAPDREVTYTTREDQALIYRLSGDRNPLHSDPTFAAAAGFERPILHGLCTYGFTGRALLSALCGADPARFKKMDARFSASVYPGDDLTIRIWDTGDGQAVFQTVRNGDQIVIDGGGFTYVN
ncbi:MAG: MaoC family dehydratase N-terminal domain-containing protein [Acidimicrobiia bacterium]|nr:MaoC family dehydratase N-terminal domain-containing protein [Acidimicrobiia bacterium]MBV9043345.1 MaoC family dehydratase N-terminal domain-containing protein [Acidimicrobiia bacterium]